MTEMQTIVAVSTPPGSGGVAMIRVSGPEALSLAGKAWRGKDLNSVVSHTAHLGKLIDADGEVIDTAVATVFRGPNSYTGEDVVELSVHGSRWIQRRVVERLVSLGAQPAGPGEFTQRAYMNGRLDLAQAEAVADVIAVSSRAANRLAMRQMSGEFSAKLDMLRERLVKLASLLELELDFSEEEVEFANRSHLLELTEEILAFIRRITASYSAGKAIKEGVPVAIAGEPNAGKSTLLNALLGEDKAIVSDVPGTTRDVIEDTREINGILFRFFDTAGLRSTSDVVENIGIERAEATIARAAIALWLLPPQAQAVAATASSSSSDISASAPSSDISANPSSSDISANSYSSDITSNSPSLGMIAERIRQNPGVRHIILMTKADVAGENDNPQNLEASLKTIGIDTQKVNILPISAQKGVGIKELEEILSRVIESGYNPDADLIITNARHYNALSAGADSLQRLAEGIKAGIPADLLAQDIREALHSIGQVTGTITTPDLLQSIFQSFCIGK